MNWRNWYKRKERYTYYPVPSGCEKAAREDIECRHDLYSHAPSVNLKRSTDQHASCIISVRKYSINETDLKNKMPASRLPRTCVDAVVPLHQDHDRLLTEHGTSYHVRRVCATLAVVATGRTEPAVPLASAGWTNLVCSFLTLLDSLCSITEQINF